ncbi:uncharacterized protein K452DRAFT_360668 [Aplosporella prunicola CBS 121167]|uniref:Zn(2)-C6 fungal-type domain-containing protein n=1 Tax=Aplosporella prunicola CBS 121167 TaxID=1176127 RepID=A0A6A6B8D4_9PEZI|nr:uncharacterized protein K452DRAFT_360668 [Aplosporella prunicola CBS 121167]KAF2139464.1 hypothetical protein K452DRAFT_360668 [Aplosporella prunicola CBS 121167]
MDGSSSEQTKVGPRRLRRSHQKSRAGCANCKKRRIKCDEGKPECKNCSAFGVKCNYGDKAEGLRDKPFERSMFSNSYGPPVKRKRGRPRTNWSDEDQSSTSASQLSPASTESSSLGTLPPPYQRTSRSMENLEELRLLHHFTTREYNHAASNPPVHDPLRMRAPMLGFTYPFILHFIYEFSALDLARLEPERRSYYYSLAENHSEIGLKGVTQLLAHFDVKDCHAIYTGAVFACMNAFARGPMPGEYLLFSEQGPPQWLPLLRGLRSIIDSVGIGTIAAGPLYTGVVEPPAPPIAAEPAAEMFQCPRLDWINHFERLREFIAAPLDGSDPATDLDAFDKLRLCYMATYGGLDGSYHGNGDHQNAFVWPYQLDEDFTTRLQERKPTSLIIAAHFAVLLKNLEFIWFLEGWAEHVIAGVGKFVGESHRVWLQWPIERVAFIQREKTQHASTVESIRRTG